MASSSNALGTQLLNQFSCAICKSQLKKPRALPCLHSFCEECLRKMAGEEVYVESLICPTCKKRCEVPGGNVCNFQLDFLADRFLEVVMDMCPDAASSTDREKEANYERCYGHDKIKDMFCHSCSQVYCTDCSSDHVDHAIGSLQDAALSAVQNMTSLTNTARDRMPLIQEEIEEIRETIEDVDIQHKTAVDKLEHTFEQLRQAVKHRKADLMEELKDLHYDRVSVLKMKRNELCATIKRNLELSQRVSEVLEGDTDTDLVYKEEDMCEALYKLCNKSFVTKSDEVKVEYSYKPKMLSSALKEIAGTGEIEFHIEDEDNVDIDGEVEDYEEEEISTEDVDGYGLSTREVDARGEEVSPGGVVVGEYNDQEAKEETVRNEVDDAVQQKEVVIPEQTIPEQTIPEQKLPEQKLPEQKLPEQKLPEQKLPEQQSDDVERREDLLANEKYAEHEKSLESSAEKSTEQVKPEINAEEQILEQEAMDSITVLETPKPSSNKTDVSPRKTKSGRRRPFSTRESNPCFEVKFSAPPTDTINRYKTIGCTRIVEMGGKGHDPGQLYYPYGVTITEDDHLVVTDQVTMMHGCQGYGGITATTLQGNSRVQVLDRVRGDCVKSFGRDGTQTGQFNSPSGVTSQRGLYYVSDTGNDRVQLFDKDGVFVRCIGESKLHSPRGITVTEDKMYVANSGLGNISVFDVRTGELVDTLRNMSPHSCELQLPTGITHDPDGNVFFTDANNFFCNHFIQVLTKEHQYSHSIGVVGNKPGEFLGPSDLTLDSLGNVIITDTRNHRIQIVDKNNSLVACFGGFGRKKGLLHFPYGVCERDGVLYVSDTNNHRIQVFNSTSD